MVESPNNPDWSTIDLERLRKLPVYRLPRTYSLRDEPGGGAGGDPPGYPTYFLRCILGRTGRVLDSARQRVIRHEEKAYIAVPADRNWDWKESLRPLWQPLPMDHPRTIAWMHLYYGRFAESIFDESSLWEMVEEIRVFYPEHEPVAEWIEDPPRPPGDWYTVASRRPEPGECPGYLAYLDDPPYRKHPTDGSGCHWCGLNLEFRFREGRFG